MENKGWRTNVEIFKTRESDGPELQAPASPTVRQGVLQREVCKH